MIISASELGLIASHYEKPISFFYPPRVTINKSELALLEEELLFLFIQLPDTQKLIAIEYVKQQVEISIRARERAKFEELNK